MTVIGRYKSEIEST